MSNTDKKNELGTDSDKNAQGSFARLEDKYMLTKEQAIELIPIMQTHLMNASPVPNTNFTRIESVYFDNTNLSILREYLQQSTSRSKMRTRRYAPNGNWSSDIFIEVKAKDNGVSKKSRFQISAAEEASLKLGQAIATSATLNMINPNIEETKLVKRVGRVNNFIENLATRPACNVSYSRLAYEKGSFRVTLDQDLEFQHLLLPDSAIQAEARSKPEWLEIMKKAQCEFVEKSYVLEVKHDGTVPAWMTEFLKSRQIEESSFSKYCYAMSFALAGTLAETEKEMVKSPTMNKRLAEALTSSMNLAISSNLALQAWGKHK